MNSNRLGLAQKILVTVFIAGVFFHIATYILSMFLGISLFFFTPEGADIATQFTRELALYIFLNISLFIPAPLSIGVIFLALWCVFWVCIILGWKGPDQSLHNVVRGSFSRPIRHLFRNYLVFFPVATSMLLLAEIFVQSLQEAHGVATGSINIPNPYELFFLASYAAVFEEVGFRLIPIGLTVSLYVLWRSYGALSSSPTLPRWKLTALTLLYPEGAKKRAGLRNVGEAGWTRGVSKPEWLIIIATASAFALAHVISGAGWGPGKFTLTLMGGFVFGLVYVVYGIAASILMHWFHNYYLTVYWLSYDIYGTSFQAFVGSVDYGIVLFGIAGWVALIAYLIYKGLTALLERGHPPEPATTIL